MWKTRKKLGYLVVPPFVPENNAWHSIISIHRVFPRADAGLFVLPKFRRSGFSPPITINGKPKSGSRRLNLLWCLHVSRCPHYLSLATPENILLCIVMSTYTWRNRFSPRRCRCFLFHCDGAEAVILAFAICTLEFRLYLLLSQQTNCSVWVMKSDGWGRLRVEVRGMS